MATAKKRTKKTAAAPTAATKAPATKGGRQPASKTGATSKKTASKKTASKKTASKKTTARAPAGADKKAASARPAANKDAPALRGGGAKKTTARKTSARPAARASAKPAGKTAPKKTAPKKTAPGRTAGKARPGDNIDTIDAEIFLPMTEGERAEALRVLLEDSRLANMASVGRYRVIALEPLAVKPPHGLAGHRLARVVIYDYASDRTVDACVDLDHGNVAYLKLSRAQPMLAREEEAAAISIALSDERVKEQLSLGEEPQVAMHYWSNNNASLSFTRRSAAVIFGRPDSSPSLIAVVDLLDNLVSEIVPATQW